MNKSRNAWKWTAALVVSLSLHAALAGTALLDSDEIEIEGGGTTELAIAGNAFQDQVAAGEVTDDIEPVEEAPNELTSETVPDTVQAETVPELVPETVIAALPEQLDAIQPEEPVAETEEVAAEPVETPPLPEEVVEPIETVEELAAVVEVPLPTPRPEYTPKPVKAEPRQKKAAPKPVAKQRTAGSRGQDKENAKRGASSTDKRGQNASGQRQARASQQGNAVKSDYAGKVQSRMQRAVRSLRTPRDATAEPVISGTISKNGSMSAVRLARGTGSANFDAKLLRRVQSARYPPVPPAVGSSFSFTVGVDLN